MDDGIAGAVADWEDRPLDGGLRQVHELADREFSGAVAVDDTWLLLINGRAVAAFVESDGPDGPEQHPADVDQLDGSGTIYEAPHEALPLLYAMFVTGGEERGRHYTGERPLTETHRELEDGGFTGYLELSEEVLSGDYYVVYQSGRSMSVAFIGGERRLRTDDAAFDRAAEEVGIYTVNAVDVDVIELPEPAPADGGADTSTAGSPGGGAADSANPPRTTGDPGGDTTIEPDGEVESEAPPSEEEITADPPSETLSEEGHSGDISSTVEGPDGPERGTDTTYGQEDGAAGMDAASSASPDALARLEARVDDLAADQERLAAAVEELRSGGTARADSGADTEPAAGATRTDRDAASVLADTTVLVRYRSDGGTTLDAIGPGEATRESLEENLQLEVRTPFPTDGVSVEGRPFRPFLESRLEYRVLHWLLTGLPFDIRESGAEQALGRLVDVLPSVDRAVFGEAATVGNQTFDLVVSSREGEPLIVARIEEDVEPPSEETTGTFIRSATEAAESEPSLAAALLVTTAYIDGASLGPAREATRTSLLDRSAEKSVVRLSGGGYHLCLVEAGESFHLALPDL